MTKSRAIIIFLTTSAIAAVVVLIHWPAQLKQALGDEPYKIFFSFSLVTVIGSLVSAAFSELKREAESREAELRRAAESREATRLREAESREAMRLREAESREATRLREAESREAKRQSLRSFHLITVSAYNRAKKLRRLMKPVVIYEVNDTKYIRKNEYVALMKELEDVQLEFEGMRRHVNVGGDLFATAPNVEAFFDKLEKYLRKVLKEFEQAPFSETGAEFKLADFPRLRGFIDESDYIDDTDEIDDVEDGFVDQFSGGYDKVEAALLNLTLG
jgi:hypothetical protein